PRGGGGPSAEPAHGVAVGGGAPEGEDGAVGAEHPVPGLRRGRRDGPVIGRVGGGRGRGGRGRTGIRGRRGAGAVRRRQGRPHVEVRVVGHGLEGGQRPGGRIDLPVVVGRVGADDVEVQEG